MTKRRQRRPAEQPAPESTPAGPADPTPPPPPPEPGRWVRVGVLLAGLLIPQVLLLGSSLWGGTLLLPLDILGLETTYLPRPASGPGLTPPKDPGLSDLVFEAEVHRRLVADEVRAGRLPLWNPYNYCGHPLLAGNQPAVFSPYRLLDYLWPSPVAVAWAAVLRALVAGVGAYLFFRRAMRVGWLAAAGGACWFPLTGTLVLSGGYAGAAVVTFLPWVLLAADAAARRPSGRAAAGLAAAVAATLLAGHAAFAGHVLVVGSVYFVARVALGRVGSAVGGSDGRPALGRSTRRRLPALAAGAVGLAGGFLLSAPQTLPTVDYLRSSNRVANRVEAQEDKPAGPAALLQLVLPYVHGSSQRGSLYIGEGVNNRIESAAGGYAGLLVAVVLVPLALADPARRRWAAFWAGLAVLAVTPAVGIPVLDLPFRLPPLSLLRNNRLVFAAALAVVALGVLGLDALARRPALLRQSVGKAGLAVGLVLAVGLAGWCGLKASDTPVGAASPGSASDTSTGSAGVGGPAGADGATAADPAAAAAAANPAVLLWPDRWGSSTSYDLVSWFGMMYRNGLLLSATAGGVALVVLWAVGSDHPPRFRWVLPAVLAAVALAELVASAAGATVRTDPALYYPRLAWMDLAAGSGGRVCGVQTLPANVLLSHRISDIRGYDGADPQPTVDLVRLARDPKRPDVSPPYAATRLVSVDPQNPGPVASLLGVRYAVGRGPPPAGLSVAWAGDDYWLAENRHALPRATVPRAARVVADKVERLRALAEPTHDPAAETLLEAAGPRAGEGTARIVEDLPDRVRIEVDMARGGLVRLADAWDAGWRATYEGRPVDVFRVDHALRAVEVPAGRGVVEFSYRPANFRWGLILAAVAAGGLTALAALWRPGRRWWAAASSAATPPAPTPSRA